MTYITSVITLLLCSAAVVSSFEVLRGPSQPALEEMKLSNTANLMRYAALSGENVTIMMEDANQTAFVQHHVHLVMDCSPLIPAGEEILGSVKWTRQSYVEDDEEVFSPQGVKIIIYPSVRQNERLKSEGSMNHILNISSTNAIPGGGRKDDGLYTCTVCTTSECRSSSLMLFLIGGPPRMNYANNNDPPEDIKPSYVDRKYRVGADFCVNRSSEEIIQLSCDVMGENLAQHTSIAFPSPSRRWYKDDVLLYSVDLVGRNVYRGMNQNFFDVKSNGILKHGLVEPSPLFMFQNGELLLAFEASELAFPEFAPEGVTNVTVVDDVFDALIGRWRCELKNIVGEYIAETIITEC